MTSPASSVMLCEILPTVSAGAKTLPNAAPVPRKPNLHYGGLAQFSFESRIQLRPVVLFPGAPLEPQSVSAQLPLWAKVFILLIAFM